MYSVLILFFMLWAQGAGVNRCVFSWLNSEFDVFSLPQYEMLKT